MFRKSIMMSEHNSECHKCNEHHGIFPVPMLEILEYRAIDSEDTSHVMSSEQSDDELDSILLPKDKIL